MGRLFVAGSSNRIQIGTAGLSGFNFLSGTIAICLQFVTLPAAGTFLASNASSGASLDFYQSTTDLHHYDVTNDRSATSSLVTATTYILVDRKAAGTATPGFSIFRFSTGAWTHLTASGTNVDSATNTQATMGSFADASASDALDATVFAIAAWPQYAMSTLEAERLVSPNWSRWRPTLWDFWDPSRDNSDMTSSLGRLNVKQTSRTGAARGTVQPPPGWGSMPIRHRR